MNIGTLFLNTPTVLAPLAGYTHLPFRLMVKELGCGLVCSEMISAKGLQYGSAKTQQMLATCEAEKPLSVQIFGAEPSAMADAARMAEAAGADVVDINFGCWVRKVIKTGAGGALMKTPGLAKAIIKAVRQSITVPLTIKIRTGWHPDGVQALAIAQIASDYGADALAIHPRTVQQGFRGFADWSVIKKIKAAIPIPVIGNGDILTPEDAIRMFAQTGCDAVMIGRAALANPLIYAQVDTLLQGKTAEPPSIGLRIALMKRLVELHVGHFGEKRACRMLRGRLGWFVKGLPHSGKFRESANRIRTQTQAMACIDAYAAFFEEYAPDLSPPKFPKHQRGSFIPDSPQNRVQTGDECAPGTLQ